MQAPFAKALIKAIDIGDDGKSLGLLTGALFTALATGTIAGAFGGPVALLSILVIAFMAVAISDYRAGLLIAIVLLPLSSSQLMPRALLGITGLNPLNAILMMTIASLLFVSLFHRGAIEIPKLHRYFTIYILTLAFAAIHGTFHVASIPSFYKTLKVISFDGAGGYLRDIFFKPILIPATAFMLSIAVRNARSATLYLGPLFFSALIMPVFVLLYIVASGMPLHVMASSQSRQFLSGTGMHANELGLMFNMALALTLFSFVSMPTGFRKWMLGLMTGILAVAVTLTFSRGAYLGCLAIAGYFLYTQRKFNTLLAAVFLGSLAVLLIPAEVVERAMTGAANRNMEDISAGRVDNIWLPLLPEIAASPFIGQGLSSILWSEAARHGLILKVGHPHSAYLGVLLDLGILGAIVVALFFSHMWRLFAQLAERAPAPIWRGFFRGAMACILLLLVQGMTDDRFTPTFSQTSLWLAYGMAIGLNGRTGSMKQNPDGT